MRIQPEHYESGGRRFDSFRARHSMKGAYRISAGLFYCLGSKSDGFDDILLNLFQQFYLGVLL